MSFFIITKTPIDKQETPSEMKKVDMQNYLDYLGLGRPKTNGSAGYTQIPSLFKRKEPLPHKHTDPDYKKSKGRR